MQKWFENKSFALPNTAEKIAKGKLTVGFLGDSVSCGGTVELGPWGIEPWPTYLMNAMQKAYPDTQFVWGNASVSGRKTSWGVDVIEECLLDKGYTDLIFIALGVNDRYDQGDDPDAKGYSQALSEEETKNNYISMLTKIHDKNPDAEIVVVLYARDYDIRRMAGIERGELSPYLFAVQQVSGEYGILVIETMSKLYGACVEYADAEKAMDEGWKHYVTDEVHVNEKGQKLYADIVWEKVKEGLDWK